MTAVRTDIIYTHECTLSGGSEPLVHGDIYITRKQVQQNAQSMESWVRQPSSTPLASEPPAIATNTLRETNELETGWSVDNALDALKQPWSAVSEQCANAAYNYLISHPGKDFRSRLISSIDIWLKVDPMTLEVIEDVVSMLHNASLLIDDIQDDSVLRRGAPAAHHIHGIPLTINSGNYVYFQAQQKLLALPNALEMVRIYNEELVNLHRGQGMDIYWRETLTVPTESDYLIMASNKTGGLFRLAIRMMLAASTVSVDLSEFTNVLGLLFQIQDDYKNLTSSKMMGTKGFCEDLTEGKMSYPIIHAIRNSNPVLSRIIVDTLRSKTDDVQLKSYIVSQMKMVTGSLDYTARTINLLHGRAIEILKELGPNEPMRMILSMLKAEDVEAQLGASVKRNAAHADITDLERQTVMI